MESKSDSNHWDSDTLDFLRVATRELQFDWPSIASKVQQYVDERGIHAPNATILINPSTCRQQFASDYRAVNTAVTTSGGAEPAVESVSEILAAANANAPPTVSSNGFDYSDMTLDQLVAHVEANEKLLKERKEQIFHRVLQSLSGGSAARTTLADGVSDVTIPADDSATQAYHESLRVRAAEQLKLENFEAEQVEKREIEAARNALRRRFEAGSADGEGEDPLLQKAMRLQEEKPTAEMQYIDSLPDDPAISQALESFMESDEFETMLSELERELEAKAASKHDGATEPPSELSEILNILDAAAATTSTKKADISNVKAPSTVVAGNTTNVTGANTAGPTAASAGAGAVSIHGGHIQQGNRTGTEMAAVTSGDKRNQEDIVDATAHEKFPSSSATAVSASAAAVRSGGSSSTSSSSSDVVARSGTESKPAITSTSGRLVQAQQQVQVPGQTSPNDSSSERRQQHTIDYGRSSTAASGNSRTQRHHQQQQVATGGGEEGAGGNSGSDGDSSDDGDDSDDDWRSMRNKQKNATSASASNSSLGVISADADRKELVGAASSMSNRTGTNANTLSDNAATAAAAAAATNSNGFWGAFGAPSRSRSVLNRPAASGWREELEGGGGEFSAVDAADPRFVDLAAVAAAEARAKNRTIEDEEEEEEEEGEGDGGVEEVVSRGVVFAEMEEAQLHGDKEDTIEEEDDDDEDEEAQDEQVEEEDGADDGSSPIAPVGTSAATSKPPPPPSAPAASSVPASAPASVPPAAAAAAATPVVNVAVNTGSLGRSGGGSSSSSSSSGRRVRGGRAAGGIMNAAGAKKGTAVSSGPTSVAPSSSSSSAAAAAATTISDDSASVVTAETSSAKLAIETPDAELTKATAEAAEAEAAAGGPTVSSSLLSSPSPPLQPELHVDSISPPALPASPASPASPAACGSGQSQMRVLPTVNMDAHPTTAAVSAPVPVLSSLPFKTISDKTTGTVMHLRGQTLPVKLTGEQSLERLVVVDIDVAAAVATGGGGGGGGGWFEILLWLMDHTKQHYTIAGLQYGTTITTTASTDTSSSNGIPGGDGIGYYCCRVVLETLVAGTTSMELLDIVKTTSISDIVTSIGASATNAAATNAAVAAAEGSQGMLSDFLVIKDALSCSPAQLLRDLSWFDQPLHSQVHFLHQQPFLRKQQQQPQEEEEEEEGGGGGGGGG